MFLVNILANSVSYLLMIGYKIGKSLL